MTNDAPHERRTTNWTERITPRRFAGNTVIITGAASGIGRATLPGSSARTVAWSPSISRPTAWPVSPRS